MNPNSQSSEARIFLTALFGRKPSHTHILLIVDGEENFFDRINDAASCMTSHKNDDVAISPFLYRIHPAEDGDAPQIETIGLPVLCASIQIDATHETQRRWPASTESALSIAPPELPPTIAINCGDVTQFWWAYEHFTLVSLEELHRWTSLLQSRAEELGFDPGCVQTPQVEWMPQESETLSKETSTLREEKPA